MAIRVKEFTGNVEVKMNEFFEAEQMSEIRLMDIKYSTCINEAEFVTSAIVVYEDYYYQAEKGS